jgi:hypothetical protein
LLKGKGECFKKKLKKKKGRRKEKGSKKATGMYHNVRLYSLLGEMEGSCPPDIHN